MMGFRASHERSGQALWSKLREYRFAASLLELWSESSKVLQLAFVDPLCGELIDFGLVTAVEVDVTEFVSDDVFGLGTIVVAVRMEHR